MELIKNEDETYKGIKYVDMINGETDEVIENVKVEYPRLKVKWADDIVNGTIEDVEVIKEESVNQTLFTLTLQEDE